MSDIYSKKENAVLECYCRVSLFYLFRLLQEFYQLSVLATTPHQRAESIGTFRLWRDLGLCNRCHHFRNNSRFICVNYAIILIGLITIASSVIKKYGCQKTINIILKERYELENQKNQAFKILLLSYL
jgi:hypothetical protein